MVLTLHMTPLSPPSRAVLLTAEALGLKLEIKTVDLSKGDHRRPKFLQLNPQHAVPVLVDDGLVICDSHAINAYLVRKYGQEDDLYPKDFYKRALVDQRLHFDTGSLFKFIREIAGPIFYGKTRSVPEEKANAVRDAYGVLEKILETAQWAAGDRITIADFSLITTITSLGILVPIDSGDFPKVTGWIKAFEQLPISHVNNPGLADFKSVLEKCMFK